MRWLQWTLEAPGQRRKIASRETRGDRSRGQKATEGYRMQMEGEGPGKKGTPAAVAKAKGSVQFLLVRVLCSMGTVRQSCVH